jgi:hypothetical protein
VTPRERILAIGVGSLVVLLGGQVGLQRVRHGLEVKRQQIDLLDEEIGQQMLAVRRGSLAREKLNSLRPRSLPSNPDLARDMYQSWLTQLESEVGLPGATITPSRDSQVQDAYTIREFNFSTRGRLDQLVELLYAFYASGFSHRISTLDVTPDPQQPYALDIKMTIQALSLIDAPASQPLPATAAHQLESLDSYLAVILERNIFSGPNAPPQLAARQRESVELGRELVYSVGASDPEGLPLSYRLLEGPDSARIDQLSGRLSWRPRELGEFQFRVEVTDDGIPQRSAQQLVTVQVVEPPPPAPEPERRPPPPTFDAGRQAFVTALIIRSDGRSEVWLNSRIEDRRLQLRVGDTLEVGQIKGRVVGITPKFMEVESDGQRWLAGTDESLSEAYRRQVSEPLPAEPGGIGIRALRRPESGYN